MAGSANTFAGVFVAGGKDSPVGLSWDLLPYEADPGEDDAGLVDRVPAVDEELWAMAADQGWDLPRVAAGVPGARAADAGR